MDLDTFLTTLYVLVDEWYTAHQMAEVLKRPGPQPKLSDSEVLCIALAGQWRQGVPWASERGVVRYMQAHGKSWFPHMLERSRFNQRVRNLWSVVVQLQQDLAQHLTPAAAQAYEIVDCLPVPTGSLAQSKASRKHWLPTARVGYGGNQGKMYWGHQVLVSMTPTGAVSGWLLAAAHVDDRWLLQGLLSQRAGQAELLAPLPWRPHRRLQVPAFMAPFHACGQVNRLAVYLADKGFNGGRWFAHWRSRYGVTVLTPPPAATTRAALRWFSRRRPPIESVFAVLSEVLGVKRLQAHSLWGLYTRMALVTCAHNLGLCLNQTLGRGRLSHATLIC